MFVCLFVTGGVCLSVCLSVCPGQVMQPHSSCVRAHSALLRSIHRTAVGTRQSRVAPRIG